MRVKIEWIRDGATTASEALLVSEGSEDERQRSDSLCSSATTEQLRVAKGHNKKRWHPFTKNLTPT